MPKQSNDLPDHFLDYSNKVAIAIGSRVKSRRASLKVTQEVLRTRLELNSVAISRSRLSRIENGESLPTAVEIIALALVLRVSFEWLLLGTE